MKQTPTTLCWHYTVEKHWNSIFSDGLIKPTGIGIEAQERPAVWFSLNQHWEETVGKGICSSTGEVKWLASLEEHVENGIYPIRIGVSLNSQLINWNLFCRKNSLSEEGKKSLENVALEKGANPREWRISFRDIPKKKWLRVEKYDGQNWNPMSF